MNQYALSLIHILPTPEVEYHNIVAQPTEHQQEMVKALSERASLVHLSLIHI